MPDYNKIAWLSDFLSKLVFGSKQKLARKAFLDKIPDNAKILIVGGGTGQIIKCLGELNRPLAVDFVELSTKMISYARRRNPSQTKVHFYNQSILQLEGTAYDFIITNFFFDQFSQANAQLILAHIKPKLKPEGQLFFSDFTKPNNLPDKLFTRLMFWFFQITTNMTTNAYPNYERLFLSLGLFVGSTKKISRNIVAVTYSREPLSL